MTGYLILFAIVLGVNLMPAFGPPTWAILVLYGLQSDLEPVPMILAAAVAAALGRFLLAHAFRLLGNRLPQKYRRNLIAAREALEHKRRNAILVLALFVVSPLPSAQLFEAAGLTGVRLLPFTLAFFLGRAVTYSIYVFTAHEVKQSSLGDAFQNALTSPVAVAVQVAMIGLLVLFARIDWAKWLGRKKS